MRDLPRRGRVSAMVQSLQVADAEEASLLVAEALHYLAENRQNKPLTRAVVGAWPRLGMEGRSSVCLALGAELIESASVIEQDSPGLARQISADCIGQAQLREALCGMGCDPLASESLVAIAVRFRSGEAPAQSARARRAMVGACAVLAAEPERLPGPCRRLIDRELVEWAKRYDEHRDQAVLRAVLAMTRRPGPRLQAWLQSGRTDEHLPLRSSAAKVDLETSAGLVLGWLGWASLVPAARRVIERIAADPEPDLVERMLERWAVLRVRHRSHRLGQVLNARQLMRLLLVEPLSDHARAGLVEIAGCLGPAGIAALMRSGVVVDPDPSLRLRVVCQLASAGTGDSVDDGLQDLGYDRDPCVARAAVGAIARLQSRHRRMASVEALHGLSRSADSGVRGIAGRTIERFDPWAVRGDQGLEWSCPGAARWMLAKSPDTFLDGLRARLRRTESAPEALWLCRRLGLASRMCTELIDMAERGESAWHRASATLLLGEVKPGSDAGDRAFGALADLLGDPDARVRANSLEALSKLRGGSIRLDRYAGDDSARIRANAVHHVCRVAEQKGTAGHSDDVLLHLDAMLNDDRPEHRISALWVASRIRPLEMASQIATIARSDEDVLVRLRARRCAMRLLSAMEPSQEVAVG